MRQKEKSPRRGQIDFVTGFDLKAHTLGIENNPTHTQWLKHSTEGKNK